MLENKLQIEQLIGDGKLAEAMELLKVNFTSKKVSDYCFKLLYRIVRLALEKNDVTLAINAAIYAAIYGTGWFGHIEVPKEASWNTIIHRCNKLGGFPKTAMEPKLLAPGMFSSAPGELTKLAGQIWALLRDHNWEIPGYEVTFDTNSHGLSSTDRTLFYKVSEIRGKDFIIGFHGIQGRLSWDLNNTAGFNFIAAPHFCIEFYEDHSGPSLYSYSENKWSEDISTMVPHAIFGKDGKPGWQKVECNIPRPNSIFIEHLFDMQKNTDEINARSKTGYQIQQQFVATAVSFLKEQVIPDIEEKCLMNSAENSAEIDRKYSPNM